MAKYSRRDFMKRSAVAGAAALVPPPHKKADGPVVRTETININIVGGKITYDLCRGEVSPGDRVQWNCAGHPFAIHFPGATPVGQISFHSTNSILIEIPPNALYGCFKYFVAVYDGSGVLTDDPDIIINPKPKG
jgi:plastocyanin